MGFWILCLCCARGWENFSFVSVGLCNQYKWICICLFWREIYRSLLGWQFLLENFLKGDLWAEILESSRILTDFDILSFNVDGRAHHGAQVKRVSGFPHIKHSSHIKFHTKTRKILRMTLKINLIAHKKGETMNYCIKSR